MVDYTSSYQDTTNFTYLNKVYQRASTITMSRNYSVTEPHPSVPKSGAYIYGGRGGAGNYRRYKAEDLTSGPTATGPSSRVNVPASSKRHAVVATGRGGAGNMVRAYEAEERVFSFDEELVRQRQNSTPIYHIGRGGAANWVDESRSSDSRRTESVSSDDSTSSKVRGALGKVTRKFSTQS